MGRPGEFHLLDSEMERAFAENNVLVAMQKIEENPKLRRKWENFHYYLRCWVIDARTRAGQIKKLGAMTHVRGKFIGKLRNNTRIKLSPKVFVNWARDKGEEAFNMLRLAPIKKLIWKYTKSKKIGYRLNNYENWVKAIKNKKTKLPKNKEGLTILGLELMKELRTAAWVLNQTANKYREVLPALAARAAKMK